MFAWNARVGNSLDKTLSHPFVAQAGTRSHWKGRNKIKFVLCHKIAIQGI